MTNVASCALPDPRVISIEKLPISSYQAVWEKQKAYHHDLINNNGTEHLIACQHFPVITRGKRTKEDSLIANNRILKEKGIDLVDSERGGDITYHGPGQVVVYPIIDLNFKKKDVDWYMRSLEEVILLTLQNYEIKGIRVPGKTGVWITNDSNLDRPRKIASIGVKLSRWKSMHGFSLNVKDCSDGFSMIHACGYHDIIVTSMESEKRISFDISAVTDNLVSNFCNIFNFYTI
jgi:lipoyl(octanoyl) transferase